MDIVEVARVVLIVTVTIIVYESIRSFIKAGIRRRFEKDLRSFLRTPDLYHQHFKFTNKLIIKQLLLSDPEINRKIHQFARREDLSIDQVRVKVEAYLDEIVPSFNLLSYYKIGYNVARTFIHAIYDPVVDRQRRKVLEELPEDASPVYIMNHRSNADFVLLGYILAGKVSISYAVGEWARVWPLETLFRSFGSYLVRRGYKEDLYHKVVERYVQISVQHGVAQAIFPEGRLSRDGYLLKPKLGLLNWLSGVERDPDFKGRLVFIPVGINYDWVLEDKTLVAEGLGRGEPAGFLKKLQVVLLGPFFSLGFVLINTVRRLFGRPKLYGHASLSFGDPIVFRDFIRDRGGDLKAMDVTEHRQHIQALGDRLMEAVGSAIPAPPTTVVSLALADRQATTFTRDQLVSWVVPLSQQLAEAGVRLAHGKDFRRFKEALSELEDEPPVTEDLADVERGFLAQEQAEKMADLGLEILRRHKIVKRGKEHTWRVVPGKEPFLRYYANSIAHHLDRRFTLTPEDAEVVEQSTAAEFPSAV